MAITLQIAIAEVVSEDEYNIGHAGGESWPREKQQEWSNPGSETHTANLSKRAIVRKWTQTTNTAKREGF
jgi:hypothetical protein